MQFFTFDPYFSSKYQLDFLPESTLKVEQSFTVKRVFRHEIQN